MARFKRKYHGRKRRFARAAAAASIVLALGVVSSMTPFPRPAETENAPTAAQFAYARNLAKISPDLGELHAYLKRWPNYATDILRAAGVDLDAFCRKYPGLLGAAPAGGEASTAG